MPAVAASRFERCVAEDRQATWHAAAAFACLVAAVLVGRLLDSDTVVWISAVTGYFSLAWFLHRALVLWDIDLPLRLDPREVPRAASRFTSSLRDFQAGPHGLV